MHVVKFAAFLAASVFVAAPAFSAEEAAKTPAKTEQSFPAIKVVAAAERSLTDRVVVTGTVQAVEEVYVQPQVDGLRIEELKADIGDEVKQGETLATLSTDSLILQKSQLQANRAKMEAVGSQLEAQMAEAKVNEAEAIRQAERAERLVKSVAVPKAQAEQLRATANASTARVNSANQAIFANNADIKVIDAQIADIDLKLARTEIKAPVGGIVSARTAKIGAIASGAGNPLFTIIRDNAIELRADVPEGDILKLKKGQVVHMAVAGTETKVDGKVRTVDPIIDAVTRLGSVKIIVDDPAIARIGMYASAEIVISDRKVISLPLTAVTSEEDGMYVRKVQKNGVVKMQKVSTGVQDGNYVEISSGLQVKDVVVEKAGAYVRDGDRVTPVFPQTTASN